MDDRVKRLMRKAEEAADNGDIERADIYRILADQAAYHARKEAKMLSRIPVMKDQ